MTQNVKCFLESETVTCYETQCSPCKKANSCSNRDLQSYQYFYQVEKGWNFEDKGIKVKYL